MRRIATFISTTWRDSRALARAVVRDREALTVINLTLLPWCLLIVWKPDPNSLVSLGEIVGFIAFYWLVARGRPVAYLIVRRPRLELVIGLALVGLWMLYRVGQYWDFFMLPEWKPGVCDDLSDTIIPKMIEMVTVPLVILLVLRYSPGAMGIGWNRFAWLVAGVPITALLVQGLSHHPLDKFAPSTLCFWGAAGLPEEFLFRAYVQTRLESILGRSWLSIFLVSFIFGVTHIPINLHGSFDKWQDALLTAFTYQMGVGIALGYAYHRLRDVLSLSVVHALIDSAP